MTFAQPIWLYLLGVIVPLGLALVWWTEKRSQTMLSRFAASKLVGRLADSFSPARHRSKLILSGIALVCIFVALARPQYGSEQVEHELLGTDIVFALDTSRSMLAEDYAPNRLERSKLAVIDLLEGLSGDRVGLIAFAGDAYLQVPLTSDYDSFMRTLNAMDTNIIPRGGTDIAAAIDEALAYFANDDHHRVLVLISDGEDLEAEGILKAREAAEQGVTIFTVGVGSEEGELIPIRGADGRMDYVRGPDGSPVRTRLDESTLRTIAEVTGGRYIHLGAAGIDSILDDIREAAGEEQYGVRVQTIPIERYHWPLMLALLLIVIEVCLGNRKRLPKGRAKLVSVLLIGLCGQLLLPEQLQAGSPRAAQSLYDRGEYEEAANLYQQLIEAQPDDARLHYNLGNTLYRLRDFEAAIEAYERALPLADVSLQERIFFNLGNARYQLGTTLLEDAPRRTTELWDTAVRDYDNALDLRPDAADALGNRQWVERQFEYHSARVRVSPLPPEGGTAGSGGRFLPGIVIDLEAEPEENWRFVEWRGVELEAPESPRQSWVVDQDADIQAVFIRTWQLNVEVDDPERGSAGTSGRFDDGSMAELKAEAEDYYVFSRWISDNLEVSDPFAADTQVLMDRDGSVTASFVDAYKLTVDSEPRIAGNVGHSGFFEVDTDVPIQAAARDGFEWQRWRGDGLEDFLEPQTSVHLDSDRTVTAEFERIWNLVVLPDSDEHGSTTGGGNFSIGVNTPIEATANEGYTFQYWDGPGVLDPESAVTEVEVLSNEQTIIAVFESEDPDPDPDSEQPDSDDPESDDPQSDEPDADDPESDDPESGDSEHDSNGEDSQDPETDPDSDQESENGEQDTTPEPESITDDEAEQILQTLRGDERQLPVRPALPEADRPVERDW